MGRNTAAFQGGQGLSIVHDKGQKVSLHKVGEGEVSSIDYHLPEPNRVYISMMNTPWEYEGNGYSSYLVNHLYNYYPNHTIDFGDIVHPAAEHIMEKMMSQHGRTVYSTSSKDWTCKECGEENFSRDMLREHEEENH
jgi:hypothetical protein